VQFVFHYTLKTVKASIPIFRSESRPQLLEIRIQHLHELLADIITWKFSRPPKALNIKTFKTPISIRAAEALWNCNSSFYCILIDCF